VYPAHSDSETFICRRANRNIDKEVGRPHSVSTISSGIWMDLIKVACNLDIASSTSAIHWTLARIHKLAHLAQNLLRNLKFIVCDLVCGHEVHSILLSYLLQAFENGLAIDS
jgi:hypothetical protein